MRRSVALAPRRWNFLFRLAAGFALALGLALATLQAQIPGRNVNMVSGATFPEGDPFLQRQNEPSIAASTRNPQHLLGGSNDYRTVDLPFPADGDYETGDAWLGLFKSRDGGQRWTSTLLPGYPQDNSPDGLASPIKGYQAGADAVVRAGTSGLFFYSGLAFDRADNGRSAIFMARFIDNNNQEAGDPVGYLGTSIVASSDGSDGRFLDKPWMAVDIPRGSSGPTCIVSTPVPPHTPRPHRPWWWYLSNRHKPRPRPGPPGVQRVHAGNVYVAYSSITGDGPTLRSEIYLAMSENCGATWSRPVRVSRTEDAINQGATIAIDPRTGTVYVAWRRFGLDTDDADSVMVARMPQGSRRFDPPGWARRFPKGKKAFSRLERLFEHRKRSLAEAAEVSEFDQGTSTFSFRSNAYPTMTVDHSGRLYLAWSERGFAAMRPGATDGDTRIVMTTSTNGQDFSVARAVDEAGQEGHQIMPTLAFAGGRLMLVYYDVRETRARPFGKYISDQGTTYRQTMDIRAVMGTPGATPQFASSVKVSDYLMGFRSSTGALEQLQVNPPNFPMFKQGTVPFIGDYIDVTPAPMFVIGSNGRWAYNTATTPTPPLFHAVWTDNRDVRPPVNGNWSDYTPPTSAAVGSISLIDPLMTPPVCNAGNAGSRNQNVYTARITGGLVVGSPGNSKNLSPTLQRGFVVFAQNTTTETRSFRMRILQQPAGGRASFEQFPVPPYTLASPPAVTSIDMTIPPRSTAARTVYATSTDPRAPLSVDVSELDAVGAPLPTPGGLAGIVAINSDSENPDLENPDGEDAGNPDVNSAEVYTPDVENPDVENTGIQNPDVENPDVENPDVENVRVANPDIESFVIANPDVENPDVENPDIENPDVENPDVENGALTDITWQVTNTGNTTAAFNVNLFLAQENIPSGLRVQLILHKSYTTPVTTPNGCDLKFETRNVLVANVPNPVFIVPSTGGVPDQNDSSDKNATIWLAPEEIGKITLRVVDDDVANNDIITNQQGQQVSVDPAFNPETAAVTPGVASQGVASENANGGQEDPSIVTPTGLNLFFLQLPVNAVAGQTFVPPLSVQVRDHTAALLPGVTVTLTTGDGPEGASIANGVAVTAADGIASFPNLTFDTPGPWSIVATVTSGGVPASAASPDFAIGEPLSPLIVNSTNDSGRGSLRAAIEYANANENDGDVIEFRFAGDGHHIIRPTSPLPVISDDVTVDGTTQPGYVDAPLVGISGELLPPDSNGFVIGGSAGPSTIRGLVINNFGSSTSAGGSAIVLLGSNNTVERNFIGTDMSGLAPAAVANYNGVLVTGGATGNTIGGGGDLPGRNVISGNVIGVQVQDATVTAITGNVIGTDASGMLDLGNERWGISVDGQHVTIEGNVIAHNGKVPGPDTGGVHITGSSSGVSVGPNMFNGNSGLAIDLGDVGVTDNDKRDVDVGPNLLQNFPGLKKARNVPGPTTSVDFEMDSTEAGAPYTLSFYRTPTCHSSGHGEGFRMIGIASSISHIGAGTAVLTEVVTPGEFIVATVTDANGNTSEFSACTLVLAQ